MVVGNARHVPALIAIKAEHPLIGLLCLQDDFSAGLMQKKGLAVEKIRDELVLLPSPGL
jgi:hypothetical protein